MEGKGKEAVQINPEILQADLKLTHTDLSYCSGVYYGRNYSCLMVEFFLKRDFGASLFQTYGPTLFIVIISWISFWIDPASVPGRIGLAITTLLTLSTQAAGIRLKLPAVSYAKALDIWLGVCMVFLFGVLVEFAWVNQCKRRQTQWEKKRDVHILQVSRDSPSAQHTQTDDNNKDKDASELLLSLKSDGADVLTPKIQYYRNRAETIDYYSRIIFPLSFSIFALVYWCVYLLG